MSEKTKCTKVTIKPGNSVSVSPYSNPKQDCSATYGQPYVPKMPEYIEREEAVRTAINAIVEVLDLHTSALLVKIACKMRKQPAADVVEVVRCKNCEKWDTSNKLLNTCACTRWSQSMPYPRLTSPDDFCSYGERKEGAEE